MYINTCQHRVECVSAVVEPVELLKSMRQTNALNGARTKASTRHRKQSTRKLHSLVMESKQERRKNGVIHVTNMALSLVRQR